MALFKSKALLNNRSWKYFSPFNNTYWYYSKEVPLGLTFQYKWNLENFSSKVFLLPVHGMYLDLDFLIVLFGILNRGLETCSVCRWDITVLQHCLWHLIESESWAPRDNLLQLGRKGESKTGIGVMGTSNSFWEG